MSALDTLLATQQAPNILGAYNQGQQTAQSNRLNQLKLQQAETQAQQAPALAAQKQRSQELVDKQRALQIQGSLDANKRKMFDDGVSKVAASIKGTESQEEYQAIVQGLPLDPKAKEVLSQFTPAAIKGLKQSQSGMLKRVQSSTILDDGTVQVVYNDGTTEIKAASEAGKSLVADAALVGVNIQEKRAEARGAGKGKSDLVYKPQIESAVTKARIAAQNQGEVFNELSQAKAALPSLNTAVDELRELSSIATSTLGGKLFNAAVKETGFGATEGATARAKFIAIINNQVLPLLKPTFGAAFTVQEGESLKATMGDPDASPAEKMAQLDAFIAQKMRDIETKQSQLGIEAGLPEGVTEDDITETMRANNMTREQVLQRLNP